MGWKALSLHCKIHIYRGSLFYAMCQIRMFQIEIDLCVYLPCLSSGRKKSIDASIIIKFNSKEEEEWLNHSLRSRFINIMCAHCANNRIYLWNLKKIYIIVEFFFFGFQIKCFAENTNELSETKRNEKRKEIYHFQNNTFFWNEFAKFFIEID